MTNDYDGSYLSSVGKNPYRFLVSGTKKKQSTNATMLHAAYRKKISVSRDIHACWKGKRKPDQLTKSDREAV